MEEKPRSGPPPKVDLRVETEVVALVCSSPPNGYDRWTYELLKREADQRCSKKLSKSTLRSILKEHHLKPWKKKDVVRSEPDARIYCQDVRPA